MESTKVSALLVLAMLAFSSPMVLACGSASCTTPSGGTGTTIPSVGGVVGTVTPVVGGAVPTVGGVASPVVGTVTGAVPTVGGVASPVVGKVGGMVTPVVGAVGGMVSPVVGTVGGAVPTVGGVVGTVSPVVGTVGGAVPTVGGIVGIVAPIIGGGSPSPKRHGGRKACPPSPPTPTPSPPTPAPTPPTPTPSPTPSSDTCPIDTLKLGVCLSILGNEVHIGDSKVKCCALVQGVAGLTAAACLCTAIKAKVLDLSLYVPLALSLLVNDCGCAVPPGYKCA
ncbi:uncharacterized protein [Lolium perenne]|jgi:hypothetical protein|uniref:uncharacterized protein n=1 Tax=Lolium perenne TaxID=4522 RepID=UPI0021EB024B|nr:leucine-rich repeat extensin-like protein 5 [Lolium perenne]